MSSDTQATQPVPVRRDHRQEVTDSMVRMLEEGVAPWQKPWQATGMPFNPTTERRIAAAMQYTFSQPRRFLTESARLASAGAAVGRLLAT